MGEQHINNGKLELVPEHEKKHTRMLFSSAVFRVKRTKTVWTKYDTTEERTNRETRHSCINVTQPYYLQSPILRGIFIQLCVKFDVKPGEEKGLFSFSYEIKHEDLIKQIKNSVIYT